MLTDSQRFQVAGARLPLPTIVFMMPSRESSEDPSALSASDNEDGFNHGPDGPELEIVKGDDVYFLFEESLGPTHLEEGDLVRDHIISQECWYQPASEKEFFSQAGTGYRLRISYRALRWILLQTLNGHRRAWRFRYVFLAYHFFEPRIGYYQAGAHLEHHRKVQRAERINQD